MKKALTFGLLSLFFLQISFAQESKEARNKRMQWWREARFGLFIHWGPYAVWGGVYHGNEQKRGGAEWIMNRCKIPVAEYQQAASTFNPVKYDAESWVLLAKEAGMKYIVITSKHHDGFAMFKSNASKFNIVDFTPYKKDVLEALAKACKKHNMKLGFYYSQAQDWNNPGGAVARKVAGEGWENPDSARIDAFTAANKGHWDLAQMTSTMDEYINRVAIPQVKELMTNYGEVAVLWWDTPTNMTDENALKLQALLKLQPNIITNDRLKRPNFPGDTGTPEQKIPGADEVDGKDWETCMTMNGTWGYRTNDDKWKSPETLIRNLCDIASKGGNYLLNVGPDALGQIPQPSIDRLKAVGSWMKVNGEAIYATHASPIGIMPWGRCTKKEIKGNSVLYFSVFDWPKDGQLVIPGLEKTAIAATLLANGTSLKTSNSPTGMVILVPEKAPDAIASVIKVTIKGSVSPVKASETKKMKTGALELWYNQPAKIWEEALPLGNGTTGAMVFGGINNEHYALNDHTLWSGSPIPGNKAKGPEILPKVREAIFNGDYGQAATLWKGMHGPYSARYLPLGDLFLKFAYADTLVQDYKRSLSLDDALSTVVYTKDKVTYKRESFVSFPEKTMAVKLSASIDKKISFEATLTSKLRYTVRVAAPDLLILSGKAPKYVAHRIDEPQQIVYDEPGGEGMTFEIHLKLIAKGGEMVSSDHSIGIKNADEVVLLMTEATSFNGFDKSPGKEGKDPAVIAKQQLSEASAYSYQELRNRHLKDYRNLFQRVDLNLGSQKTEVSTDERMLAYNKGQSDNGLVALYFQYGRYLMIASSRPGTPPTNLQGIWNQLVQPPWGSNYTTNINTEMNYWPAEQTNLSECHEPLLSFLKQLAVNGAQTAKINYGIQSGWLVHHNSDIWAKTSPAGGEDWDPRGAPRWSAWPMAGAWFSRHLWEHYQYTGDKLFLEKQAWPLMKGAAEFCLAWLVEDKNGLLVTNPGSSPENTFKVDGKVYEISMASTMDMSIIRELFSNCLQASRELKTDPEFAVRLEKAIPKLYPFHIGQYGQLQEWFKDWDDPKDTHRHISHLFSLYPGNMITPEYSPELAKAAKQTLIHRGDVSTGWSMAWKVNWWARLKDGDHALKILKDGLQYIGSKSDKKGGGGSYPNLFCSCPPFQIDGNFGGTAGIAEMLVQSHEGYIHLLPALPAEWPTGEINGLVTRGGFVVNMKWQNGKLTEATVTSKVGGKCRIKVAGNAVCREADLKIASGKNSNPLLQQPDPLFFGNNSKTTPVDLPLATGKLYEWPTTSGNTYHLTFN